MKDGRLKKAFHFYPRKTRKARKVQKTEKDKTLIHRYFNPPSLKVSVFGFFVPFVFFVDKVFLSCDCPEYKTFILPLKTRCRPTALSIASICQQK